MPGGVMIYGDNERIKAALPPPKVPREEVIDELVNAVYIGKKPFHDGAWALANLEVCLALIESAKKQKEINLKYQCPLSTSVI